MTKRAAPNVVALRRPLVSTASAAAVAAVKAAADHAVACPECDAAVVRYADESAPVDEAVAVAMPENCFEKSLLERRQQRRVQGMQAHGAVH